MNDIPLVLELATALFGSGKYRGTRIARGEVNRVYVVEGGSSKLLFRLNEVNELKRFEKEHWCMAQASQLGIPTPEVHKVGSSQNVAYMVTAFIEGVSGDDVQPSDRTRVWQRLGDYARQFADIKIEGFGDEMSQPGVFSDSWSRFLGYNIDSLNSDDLLLDKGLITTEQQTQLKETFTALHDQPFNVGLSHGDLSLNNVVVDRNQNMFLLDWGCAEAHFSPFGELIGVLENGGGDTGLEPSNEDFKTFVRSYGLTEIALKEVWDQLLSLWLLRRTDKLRWAIDRQPDLTQDYTEQLQAVLKQVN